jgi:hypothetical protein
VLFPTQNAVKTYVDNQVSNVSANLNFVDLTTNQTIAGNKSFSGRIGIGTNSNYANSKLHIAGNGLVVWGGSGTLLDASGNNHGHNENVALTVDGKANNDILQLRNTSPNTLLVVDKDGNMGIGNTTPSQKLEVTGNIKTTGTLTAGTVTYPNAHNSTAGQVLTTNASGVASWTTPSGSAHYVGETYGGGIVFYVWDNGAHGLIGANTELNNGQPLTWGGGSNAYVGTISTNGVLGGKINTQRILNVIPVPTYGNGDPQTGQRSAAFYAATYYNPPVVVNGVTVTPQFSDWYLPNAHELTLFATQSALFPNCNFATHDHWTSQERNDYAYLAFALAANSNTYIYQTNKSSTNYVVAIRSF